MPEAVPEVAEAVADPVAYPVAEVTEADGEPLRLEIGITGKVPELDVTGTTEDKFDVSGTGTTEVGSADETPAVDATEVRIDETPDGNDTEVGRPEGSTEDTAVKAGTELGPLPRTEETTPLESTGGRIPTGVVEDVEDPVIVETETPAPLVGVPRIVSRPTVIPEEVTKGVAA